MASACYEAVMAGDEDTAEHTDEDAVWLDEAYALETPDDNRDLYARWASTYDRGFIEPTGYVYHLNVAKLFVDAGGSTNRRTLDVGCGTGVVGMALIELGEHVIDGVDISAEMLDVARTKRTRAGHPVYRRLIEADLTIGMDAHSDDFRDYYGGIVSAGTFTHGHLGPEPVDELLRVAAPGALFALGVNRDHYVERGFSDFMDERLSRGAIVDLSFHDVPIYSRLTGAHAETTSTTLLFRRNPRGAPPDDSTEIS